MPTYVYECTQCGEFERQQSISEPPLGRCPTCGGEVRRLIAGGTGFIMKGRGSSNSHCDRATPCCGRETRCDRPPCEK
jgi:putative FmdB family regulatory protein